MLQKQVIIKERTEGTSQGEVGQARKALVLERRGRGISRQDFLHIHLGGCGLTVLMDSCKLHNNRPEGIFP